MSLRSPVEIINEATGYMMGHRVIDALKSDGWTLVSAPELTHSDEPPIPDHLVEEACMRYAPGREPFREYRLSMHVGDRIIALRHRLSRYHLHMGGDYYKQAVGREMFHKFAMEQARALRVPEVID